MQFIFRDHIIKHITPLLQGNVATMLRNVLVALAVWAGDCGLCAIVYHSQRNVEVPQIWIENMTL